MAKGDKSSSRGSRSSRSSRRPQSPRKSFANLDRLSKSVSSVNDKITSTLNPVQTNPIEEYKETSFSSGYLILVAILYVINFIINVYALLWIQKLEAISCKCSESWQRDYIKYFIYVYFIILVIQVITYLATGHGLESQNSMAVLAFVSIFNVFAIFGMFVAVFYIDELKKNQCSCSEDIRREVYYYYNIIRIALLGLSILLMLATLLFLGRLLSKFS